MRKIAPILLLRLALLVAVLACAVLVVEHQNAGDPAFCGMASGCMAVRRSAWSRIGPIPLPVIGLSAHAVLLALALGVRDKVHTYYLAALATAGGIIAGALIALQTFQIGAFCKWCLMVDGSAIVAALAASWLHRETAGSLAYEAWLGALSRRRAQIVLWAGGAVIAGLLPIVWGEYPVVAPLPEGVAALAVPGKITVVSFTDFECPFCRKMHPVLHDIVNQSGGRMTLVRKMAPLAGHRGAKPAALGYLCAPADKREKMAGMLYAAPEHLLNRDGVIGIAAGLGIDRATFTACLAAPETEAALAADEALFAAIDAQALPFTFIGPRVVAGANPTAARKIARVVLAGGRPGLPVSWMLAAFAALAVIVVALTLRLAPGDDQPIAVPAS
ncbi:MAG: vitamin K epoxide reductase family protein [Minicystis sp.]